MSDDVEKYEGSDLFAEDVAVIENGFLFYLATSPGDELKGLNRLIEALMRQHDYYKAIVTAS